jgi:D-alanyl-D-alanine carboxypeptidase/D-alanyl-D-alanine-endopeptidase (penicillin-binding protein 4)
LLLALIVALTAGHVYGESEKVRSLYINDLVKSALPPDARWSMLAADLVTGEEVVAAGNNKEEALVPGSIVKLFVTGAVLENDARSKVSFDTVVSISGAIVQGRLKGNAYLIGGGNAFLSLNDFKQAVEGLRAKSVKEIKGDIIADGSLFEILNLKNLWEGPAYSSSGALGLDLHTVFVSASFAPDKSSVIPPNAAVRVLFRDDEKPGIRQIDDFTYSVSKKGASPAPVSKRFGLNDPGLYAAGSFKTLLVASGIRVSGGVKKGKAPASATIISRIHSQALPEIVKQMNNYSLNVVAENLLLKLGADRFGAPGTREKGISAISEFLLKEFSISEKEIAIADGSGVSYENRVTPHAVIRFLYASSKKPWFKSLYDSLPRSGMDGSMKQVGYVNERVRAKTGQLPDVYGLAGYGETRSGRKLAFCYIVNTHGAGIVSQVQATGGMVLKALFEDQY